MDTAVLEAQRRQAEAQLQRAPIGIEVAKSQVTQREAFYRPYFLPPARITQAEMDARMDAGLDTFAPAAADVGATLFGYALTRFRSTIGAMA